MALKADRCIDCQEVRYLNPDGQFTPWLDEEFVPPEIRQQIPQYALFLCDQCEKKRAMPTHARPKTLRLQARKRAS